MLKMMYRVNLNLSGNKKLKKNITYIITHLKVYYKCFKLPASYSC
jgi:hypothetical protein